MPDHDYNDPYENDAQTPKEPLPEADIDTVNESEIAIDMVNELEADFAEDSRPYDTEPNEPTDEFVPEDDITDEPVAATYQPYQPIQLTPIQNWLPEVDWRDVLTFAVLVVILLAGYWLRSTGRNWDDYTHLHPDERFLTDVASRVGNSPLSFPAGQENLVEVCNERYPAPTEAELAEMTAEERDAALARTGKGGYFDAECSDLNPNNIGFGLYVYGEFPLFVTRITAETLVEVEKAQCLHDADSDEEARDACSFEARTTPHIGYNGIHLIGRMVSSTADSLTVLLVFLIGLKLFGRPQGLLAAAFYAFAAFPIQQSHFWTADAFTSLWVTMAIYAAVNVLKDDASRPTRFTPLLWIAGAVGLWAWELERLDEPSIMPLIIYGVVFGLVCGAASLVDRREQMPLIGVGAAAGIIVLLVGLIAGEITILGIVGVLILSGLLTLFTTMGLNKLAAYGGTIGWLSAAFGVWVYDGLAHYQRPSLTPLVLYVTIFAVGSVVFSAVMGAKSIDEKAKWLGLFGLPLLVWVILCGLVGAFAWQGMLFTLFLLMMLGTATVLGFRDYMTFGIAFGAALASRANIAPVVGVLFLAVIIRSLPILDRKIVHTERDRLLMRAVFGVMMAGIVTIIFFRVLQPHAFTGLYLDSVHLGVIPSGINPGYTDDLDQARYLVSGAADIPPNHQWANRTPYLFPGQNIVIWGLGLPLGLAAVVGVLWALLTIVRGKRNWAYVALPSAWIVAYFGWLGKNWVSTMRYFLPLYGVLILLAAWVLVEFVRWGWQQPDATRPRQRWRLPSQVMAGLLLVVVLGYTLLYGYGMANLHRALLSRVAASLWFQENVPGNLGIWVTSEDGTETLQNIGTNIVSNPVTVVRMEEDEIVKLPLLLNQDAIVESVVLHRVTDPNRDDEPERIRIRLQRAGDGVFEPEVIAERILDTDVNEGFSDFGDEYSIRFDDEDEPTSLFLLPEGSVVPANIELEIAVLDGGPIAFSRNVSDNILPTTLDHVTVYLRDMQVEQPFTIPLNLDDAEDARPPYTFYMPSQQGQTLFTATVSGEITRLEIPHIADPLADVDDETLQVSISGLNGNTTAGEITGNFLPQDDGIHNLGVPVTIEFDSPLQVEKGESYTITMVSDAPLVTLGNVVATEGPWDDAIPYKVCPLLPDTELTKDTSSGYSAYNCIGIDMFSSHYWGTELYLAAEDDQRKRDTMISVLDEADYLTISSNRFYDSLARIPTRFPMTLDYYDALFNGDLGFELVSEWTSYPRAFGLEWKDQVLPTDDLPDWLNEYEVEEAFTVYDHPTVFIFRKTADYSPQNTREVLGTSLRQYTDTFGGFVAEAEPVNRNVITAPEASVAPTALMLPDEVEAKQKESSTWADMFDVNALINENQVAAVAAWWLMMMVIGWLTFPLLFVMFPALSDRGYGASKAAGLVLMAWMAWMGAALHLGTWSRNGIAICLAIVVLISFGLMYPRRREFWQFVSYRRWHLLTVELLSFVMFLAFLYVRYRNPDLWHNVFGGEKPMDFAYFNGVLRSETFPPLDPWFAGGYINYYYWGFVLVGAPVKLLGVVPAIAYNLIVPTVFSMVGVGAFTVAYNITAGFGVERITLDETKPLEPRAPRANPYIAGFAALLLVAVVGNLDTIRLFGTEVAKVGGWEGFTTSDQRRLDMMIDFRREEGREPNFDEIAEIDDESQNPNIVRRIDEGVSDWVGLGTGFVNGIIDVSQGEPLTMATHRWYWAPTRIIGELPDGKGHNAINEMPYFTFLYGDLHAHMLSLPIILLVMLWLSAEVMGAGYGLRSTAGAGMSLFFGGLSVGLLRATNTWDLPTFLILGAAGLLFAAWLTQTRRKEAEHLATPPLADRLREYLDLRHAVRLWYWLLLIPAGMILHVFYWAVKRVLYDSALEKGEIPDQCVQLSNLGDLATSIPELCEGKLKPVFHVSTNIAAGVGLFGVVVFLYVAALVLLGARFDKKATLAAIGRLVAFVMITFVVVIPFTNWYAGDAGLVPWESDRTPLWAYLDIHGLFIFILMSLLIWQTVRLLKRFKVSDLYGMGLPALLVLAGVPLTLLASLVIGVTSIPVMMVTLPMILWASGLFLILGTSRPERMIYAIMVLALGLTTGVELVTLNVDIGRQNMVFKFYMQAWILFGVSSGVAVAWLMGAIVRWQFVVRYMWQTALAILVTIAFMYPIMATQARWQDRFDPTRTGNTLDGQAYMQYAVYGDNGIWYNLRGDYEMIQWIEENIQGTPTIIEAQTTEYKWGSRIAINTGLPTIIGWNWHQRQQRSVLDLNQLVWNRSNNVAAFYNTTSIEEAWNLVHFYDIDYIILGVQERVTYNDLIQNPADGHITSGLNSGLAKFDRMVEMGLLEEVYSAPSCVASVSMSLEECDPQNLVTDKIYHVISDVPLSVAMNE